MTEPPWTVRQAQRYYNEVIHTRQNYLIDFATRKLKEAIRAAQPSERVMYSPDMLDSEAMQMFSVRTGERIAYRTTQQPEAPEQIDENQLTLNL